MCHPRSGTTVWVGVALIEWLLLLGAPSTGRERGAHGRAISLLIEGVLKLEVR